MVWSELKSMKLEDLVSIAEVANDFDEFRSHIIFRGIIKEDYLDFISSIKADMAILENKDCFNPCFNGILSSIGVFIVFVRFGIKFQSLF